MIYLDKFMYLVSKPMIGFRWSEIIRFRPSTIDINKGNKTIRKESIYNKSKKL